MSQIWLDFVFLWKAFNYYIIQGMMIHNSNDNNILITLQYNLSTYSVLVFFLVYAVGFPAHPINIGLDHQKRKHFPPSLTQDTVKDIGKLFCKSILCYLCYGYVDYNFYVITLSRLLNKLFCLLLITSIKNIEVLFWLLVNFHGEYTVEVLLNIKLKPLSGAQFTKQTTFAHLIALIYCFALWQSCIGNKL